MRMRPALALATTAALVLAGCAADVAAGPRGALQERLDRGVAVEVTVEADPTAIDDPEAADDLREVLDAQDRDGPLLVASRSGDGVARGLVLRGGALEVRMVDDTAYLRADAAALDDWAAHDTPPDPTDEAGDAAGEASSPGPLALLDALDGGWVGVSGLTEERLAELLDADTANVAADDETSQAVEQLLEDRDLDDLDGLFTSYATVTGDGPWQVEVHARELARALQAVGVEAEGLLGDHDEDGWSGADDAGDDEDAHDVEDLPERVGGVTVEATDGVATRVVVDLAEAMGALDHGDAGSEAERAEHRERLAALDAADARLVLTMVDVGDRVDTPEDASVVDVALVDALLGGEGDLASLGGLLDPGAVDAEG